MTNISPAPIFAPGSRPAFVVIHQKANISHNVQQLLLQKLAIVKESITILITAQQKGRY
jgi:hypothetical protein